MSLGKLKSRTFRKVNKKAPGGRNVTHYKKRTPAQAKCTKCNEPLKGVPRLRPYKMQNTPKTVKRPERPFGGVLCTKCTRKSIKEKARA